MQSKAYAGVATRLSGSLHANAVKSGFVALARLSLTWIAVSMLSGCLVEDPPPLQKAERTPPRLDYQGARPPIEQFIVAGVDEILTFTMPVTSEDAGEGLVAYLLLDYASGTPLPPPLTFPIGLPPSTLDDKTERVFTLKWPVDSKIEAGCHRITLLVAHSSTLSQENILDDADVATAVWWANLNVTAANADMLQDCASLQQQQMARP